MTAGRSSRAARSSSPAVSTRARQRASTIGTWSTRTVCTVSTRKPSASVPASGRSRARSTSSRTFAEPQVTRQERLLRERHRPQTTRHTDLRRDSTSRLLGPRHDPPRPRLGTIGRPRHPHVPTPPTARPDPPTGGSTRRRAGPAAPTTRRRAARPGHSPVSASAAERIAATTRAAPEPPPGGRPPPEWWLSIMCSSLPTATDQSQHQMPEKCQQSPGREARRFWGRKSRWAHLSVPRTREDPVQRRAAIIASATKSPKCRGVTSLGERPAARRARASCRSR